MSITHTTTGTLRGTAYEARYHDRGMDATPEEIKRGLIRNDGCMRIIVSHFTSHPLDKINADSLRILYGEYSTHVYRSRLTELGDTKKNAGYLHQLPERVLCSLGGMEHLYQLASIPAGVQLSIFGTN